MVQQIFINLPVKDLKKTREFFSKLGFTFNEQFSNDEAASMVMGENIYAMLLVEPFFKSFHNKEIGDATKTAQMINAIAVESRAKVDELVDAALASGGSFVKNPQDHGWMYGRSFADINGHQWEVLYMDETAVPDDVAGNNN
ncbi:glyoxalase/bleomycin resistance/extradiol dioxygenase family protein [Pseudoflavitalea sp. G-6-1-2]|uniref:VOC family protein n=1 Tax=Pseudoflavitalea sp. G-6-1-2 TaxID=2728841 RepID=UPI00146BE14F|nr:VOC family protein [Pseudoflavitalea sp. G-6-1-2]NML20269.1 glyoxalase/bleomycin resistance/extradiol dioxygenase family protein [Pseudoflavitalea sp. G-6-1-2]